MALLQHLVTVRMLENHPFALLAFRGSSVAAATQLEHLQNHEDEGFLCQCQNASQGSEVTAYKMNSTLLI